MSQHVPLLHPTVPQVHKYCMLNIIISYHVCESAQNSQSQLNVIFCNIDSLAHHNSKILMEDVTGT